MVLYLCDVGGVRDDGEDVEGGPGEKEDDWDQRQEDVCPPLSVLLADGSCWELRGVEALLGLLESQVNSGVGHRYYHARDQELD